MAQSELYKHREEMDYLADLVGADQAQDLLKTVVKEVEDAVDVNDRPDRSLGQVDVTLVNDSVGLEDSEGDVITPATDMTLAKLTAALASNGADILRTEQQTPLGVEDSQGNQVDPATDATLAALTAALASNGEDTLLTERTAEHRVRSPTVPGGEVYHVEAGETWVVNDLVVDGLLDVHGTLVHYGNVGGSGTITGSGEITNRSN